MLEQTSGLDFCGFNKNTQNKFQFGDYVLWFPKGGETHLGKFKKIWFGLFWVQYCLPNNIIYFFLTILNKVQYWSMLIS
jgi:hypothetical protein